MRLKASVLNPVRALPLVKRHVGLAGLDETQGMLCPVGANEYKLASATETGDRKCLSFHYHRGDGVLTTTEGESDVHLAASHPLDGLTFQMRNREGEDKTCCNFKIHHY